MRHSSGLKTSHGRDCFGKYLHIVYSAQHEALSKRKRAAIKREREREREREKRKRNWKAEKERDKEKG